ncbi:hypothetical protein FRB99_008177 [Tulasnella sp. 403]|nr:hypothetical protein FRB99_008177 [Tulasnella sp. 403]
MPSSQHPTIVISPAPSIEPYSLSSALSSLQASTVEPQLPTPPSEASSPRSSIISTSTPTEEPKFPLHFTSPSEANVALAGEGVFSPPESRSNTPPPDRLSKSNTCKLGVQYKTRKRATSVGVEALGAITDSSEGETGAEGSSDSSSIAGDSSSAFPSIRPDSDASVRRRKPALQFTPVVPSS